MSNSWNQSSKIIYLVALFIYLTASVSFPIMYRGEFDVAICGNDCTDYDNLSNYLLQTGKFAESGNDVHTHFYYRGYVALIASLKGIFGTYWGQSYIVFSGFLSFSLFMFGIKKLQPNISWLVILFATFLLISNFDLLYFSGYLLNDFIFAQLTTFVFILLTIGLFKVKPFYLIVVTIITIITLFIRPNGTPLLGYCIALIFLSYFYKKLSFSKKFYSHFMILIPLLIGLGAMVASASLTHYSIQNPQAQSLPSLDLFLKINYWGGDLMDDNRLGAIIVNFPYKERDLNDGTWLGIVGSLVKRIPKVFEIVSIPLARTHNIVYRYLYDSILYILCLIYVGYAIRFYKKNPLYLFLFSLFLGQLMIFISISHIESRYLLQFEMMMILGATLAFQNLIQDIRQNFENFGKRKPLVS